MFADRHEEAYVGTAGAMLDFSEALGVVSFLSSFSRNVFSFEIILLDVMAERLRAGMFYPSIGIASPLDIVSFTRVEED